MTNDKSHDSRMQRPMTLVFTGDVILDMPDPDYWLAGIAPELRLADVAIGHLEVPHTRHTTEHGNDVPAPGAEPDHLAALARAGFDAMTLAGNHISDCGAIGIADTLDGLAAQSLGYCGAGATLEQARNAAMLQCGQRQIAVLSYNCVGPESAWATDTRAGCAWLPVSTADGTAVAPARTLTQPTELAYQILREDIEKARCAADLVVIALHKGIVHTPAVVADYEHLLAKSAIDAGADLVISHHAHIVRGIEFHRGKPIYHGLGNGCVVTRALDPNQSHPARAEWARRRKTLFGFEPDPAYPFAPFHPEAVNAFMAKILWHADGQLEAGIVPVHVDPPGRPRLANNDEAQRIAAYVQSITTQAGMSSLCFTARDDMMVIA